MTVASKTWLRWAVPIGLLGAGLFILDLQFLFLSSREAILSDANAACAQVRAESTNSISHQLGIAGLFCHCA